MIYILNANTYPNSFLEIHLEILNDNDFISYTLYNLLSFKTFYGFYKDNILFYFIKSYFLNA